MPEGRQRLLEAHRRFTVGGRARQGLDPGLTEIRDGLLPHLASHGMVSEPLDVLGEPTRIEAFDGTNDTAVELRAPVLEHGPVRHVVSQRVLERVLGIGREARLVEELCRIQARESALHVLFSGVRHGVQQREGHVLADDRRRLEQQLVLSREPLDPGRQDHLHGRRDLDRLDRPGQTIVLSQAKYVAIGGGGDKGSAEGRTAAAEHVVVHLRSDGSAERLEADGDVTLTGAAGESVKAPRGEMTLNAQNQPQSAVMSGGVKYKAEEPLRQAQELFASMGYRAALSETEALLGQAATAGSYRTA